MPSNLAHHQSFVATTDFSTSGSGQYRFVKLDTAGGLVLAGNGQSPIGVLQDAPSSGQPGSVAGPGSRTPIQCGGSFSIGDRISCDANGKAILSVSGDFILGRAITAGASSTLADILFQPEPSKM